MLTFIFLNTNDFKASKHLRENNKMIKYRLRAERCAFSLIFA
eukprot:UN25049